jgi:hypothetical protein
MTILKAPANVSSIATSTGHEFTVVDGFIDTGTAPQKAIDQLLTIGKCTMATDEDIGAADAKTIQEPMLNQIKNNKAALITRLKEMGEAVDGRSSLAALANQYENVTARQKQREAVAQAKAADDEAKAKAEAEAQAKAAAAEAAKTAAASTTPVPPPAAPVTPVTPPVEAAKTA